MIRDKLQYLGISLEENIFSINYISIYLKLISVATNKILVNLV